MLKYRFIHIVASHLGLSQIFLFLQFLLDRLQSLFYYLLFFVFIWVSEHVIALTNILLAKQALAHFDAQLLVFIRDLHAALQAHHALAAVGDQGVRAQTLAVGQRTLEFEVFHKE